MCEINGEDTGFDSPLSDDDRVDIRENYGYLPSDYVAMVGGHRHLLEWGERPGQKGPKAPKALALSKVKEILKNPSKSGLRNEFAEICRKAVAMSMEWQSAKSPFHWEDLPEEMGHDYEEPVELIGGAVFVAWDDPGPLLELVQHHEEDIYNNGGNGVEAMGRLCIPLDAPDSRYEEAACELKAYLKRWVMFNSLLNKFPIFESEI